MVGQADSGRMAGRAAAERRFAVQVGLPPGDDLPERADGSLGNAGLLWENRSGVEMLRLGCRVMPWLQREDMADG